VVDRGPIDDDPNFHELIHPGPSNSCEAYEIKKTSNLVPKQSGIYAWYFRDIPHNIPIEGCRHYEWQSYDYTLLYVGIAPKEPAKSGKQGRTLQERIKQHINGNAESSTLRFSLGCLLWEQLGIHLCRVKPKRFSDEKALTDWICRNAIIAWSLHEKPWQKEVDYIQKLSLPLNIDCNKHHPFYIELSYIRYKARETAKNYLQEVMNNEQ